MQLQIINGYITGYALVGEISDGVETDISLLQNIDNAYISLGVYKYEDGAVTLDNEKLADINVEQSKSEIRLQREKECFTVIDRPLWLESLTENRLVELRAWRLAWLEAPDTGIIPNRPEWLN